MKKLIAVQDEGKKALVFSFQKLIFFSATLTATVIATTALTGCFSQKSLVLSKTVLTVNSHEITTKDFADRLALRLKQFDALYAKDDTNLERAKEDTVQAFILEAIAEDYAEKQGIKVSTQEVDAKITDIKSHYPDEIAFRRALADENLAADRWRDELKFTVLQKKIFAKITAEISEPTEAELKEYYEANKAKFQQNARVRLRQIVLEKEDDAKRIIEELGNGGNFASLAKKFSVAPEGANGGDTGWIEKGTLEVFDPAFKMNAGARSKIIKSPYGYHIYEVIKKEPEGRLSFLEAKAKIRAQLMERREQKIFSAWLEEQVRKSSVRRNDSLIQAIKVSTRGS
jgi:peptidyl-prolyl cis-trans isomerase C